MYDAHFWIPKIEDDRSFDKYLVQVPDEFVTGAVDDGWCYSQEFPLIVTPVGMTFGYYKNGRNGVTTVFKQLTYTQIKICDAVAPGWREDPNGTLPVHPPYRGHPNTVAAGY